METANSTANSTSPGTSNNPAKQLPSIIFDLSQLDWHGYQTRSTQAIIIARASLGKARKLVLMYPLHSNLVEDVAVVTDRFGITPSSDRVEGKRIWTWGNADGGHLVWKNYRVS
jgi:hypothetical protein